MSDILHSHVETIHCPECEALQAAVVEHTTMWNVYLHQCDRCGYWIDESGWEKVERYEAVS